MELRHLRYLVAVADAGTFVRAAETLRVAQPALTRQLHDLERELGVELFEKGARKATLTKAGDACVRLAKHVLQDTERALARARLSNDGLVGECRIVCGPLVFQSGYVGLGLAHMKDKIPGISIVVMEREGRAMWEAVVNSEADISLGLPPPASYPSLAAERQVMDTLEHALVNKKHPLAGRSSVSVLELRDYPLLMLEGTPGTYLETIHAQYVRASTKPGDEPPLGVYLPSFHSMLSHARALKGWTFIPKRAAHAFSPLVALPISDFRMPYPIARAWRRSDDRAVVKTVLDVLRAIELEGWDPKAKGVRTKPSPVRPPRPPRLELRHLRSFEQVARYGSFGRAADAMDITQPALSRQMKELEQDVGVSLFDRGARGVELTPSGGAFLADAQSILAVVEHLKQESHRAQRGTAQQCIIGVVPHPNVDRLITDAVVQMDSAALRVRIGTQMVGTPSIRAALERSDIDLGIGFSYPARVPVSPLLAHVPLYDDVASCALLSKDHPLARAKSLSLAELRDIPFLWPAREVFPPVYDVVMHQFSVAGTAPRIEGTYEGIVTIMSLAAQGIGWALGLREQTDALPHGLVSIPLRDFQLPWGGELVYRKDESRASVLAVIDAIIARARELFGQAAL